MGPLPLPARLRRPGLVSRLVVVVVCVPERSRSSSGVLLAYRWETVCWHT